MNADKIESKDLSGRNFAFKDLTDFFGMDFQEQLSSFDGFAFCLCTSGRIHFRINYSEYQVESGEMFVVLAKHIFSVLEYSDDIEVKAVFISLDFMYHMPISLDFDLLTYVNVHPCAKLARKQVEDLIKIYSVIQHYDHESKLSRQIQNTLVLSLVLIVASAFEQCPVDNENVCSRQESLTRSFFNLLLQHFKTERSVSFYADKLCITPKYLTKTIKSVTKHSVQIWINEFVLTEAKRYLRTTALTVWQISEQLNFPTDSSFVRFFRTHTGCTPLEYRKKRENGK